MKKLLFFCVSFIYASHKEYSDTLSIFLSNYRRPFTCVEITSAKMPYSLELAQYYKNGVFVIIFNDQRELPQLTVQSNVVILHPQKLPDAAVHILARCEHFDVALFENKDNILTSYYHPTLLQSVCKLADHLFIHSKEQHPLLDEHKTSATIRSSGCMYYLNRPKIGLDIARWNLHRQPELEQCRYQVMSNFAQKKLIKNGNSYEWIAGINLMTFIMLGGIHPKNENIISELKRYKTLLHNDLVIGNFIIQGQRLLPIDFNDKGRHVRSKKSVKAAIKLFKSSLRYKDPNASLYQYQKQINKSLKH